MSWLQDTVDEEDQWHWSVRLPQFEIEGRTYQSEYGLAIIDSGTSYISAP